MALYRQTPGWEAGATLDARAFSASDPGFLGNSSFQHITGFLQKTLSACLQQRHLPQQVTRCAVFPDASSGYRGGTSRLSPDLVALRRCAVKAVQQAGIATETRPYRPHITLARGIKNANGLPCG